MIAVYLIAKDPIPPSGDLLGECGHFNYFRHPEWASKILSNDISPQYDLPNLLHPVIDVVKSLVPVIFKTDFQPFARQSRVTLLLSLKRTQLISNVIYFEPHSGPKALWRGVKGGSFKCSHIEAMFHRMQFLVVFGTWRSPESVKMSLLTCPSFPANLQPIFLQSLAVTVFEASQSARFFLDEESSRNCLTVSIWRPNFTAMTWREASL